MMINKRALLVTPTVAAYCYCMISLAAVLLAAVAVGPVGAAAAAPVGPASRRPPFPAFVTPPPASATPRQRGNTGNGCAASIGLQSERRRRHGWFNSRLHQSTVSLAEPKGRNSTHDDAAAAAVSPTAAAAAAAFVFQNVTAAATTTTTATSSKIVQLSKEDDRDGIGSDNVQIIHDSPSGDADGSPSPDSDSDPNFVEPDDRHEEGVGALASYFVPGSSDRSGRSGGGSSGGFGTDDTSSHKLDDHRRAHAIAPPGYGKTLFSLLTLKEVMARDQAKIKTALYIVPKLNLADQALAACDKHGVFRGIPHKRLLIASGTNRTEERTTKPEVIARFLADSAASNTDGDGDGAASSQMRFVVSTYKSLHRVGEALRIIQKEQGLESPPSIDFAIFDEAHKTEGRSNMTGYGLYDENVDIHQRLFITATPNNYTDTPREVKVFGNRQSKDGAQRLVIKHSSLTDEKESKRVKARSFRNEELYGPCVMRRTSQECVDRKITVPVKLCCLSMKEVVSFVPELGDINITSYSREQLMPFAVQAAFEALPVNKGVSFHSLNIRAKQFIDAAKETMGDDVFLAQVSGAMSRSEQERIRIEAKSADKSLVANCDLWKEGVDVPEWDIVVIGDPVYSSVMTKQIIGRVSRPYTNKKHGYVFIPDLFDEDNGLEAGSKGYDAFVSIFQAMMADDPQLERDVLFVSGNSTEGRRPLNVTEYPARLKERFQLPASVPLPKQQAFMRSIVTEVGGGNVFSWLDWYALLKKYQDREGDCLVPYAHVEEGENLGNWVKRQRNALQNGGMTSGQKEMLDEIGFCWDVLESAWQANYEKLKAYQEQNGHCLVSKGELDDNDKLCNWVRQQRDDMKKGRVRLTAERKEMLDEIGFCWDAQGSVWQANYEKLKAYREQNGHCLVSNGELDDDNKLYRWVLQQREDMKKGRVRLTAERKELLDEIGFCWDVPEYEWERSFKLLEQFAKREGHCDVPRKHVEDGENLGKWLDTQRLTYRKGNLDETRQRRLEELGVNWNPEDAVNNRKWMHKFNLLVKFKEREGHCRVPDKHKEDDENLGYWLSKQKYGHSKGKLDPERYDKLKELGVEW